MRKQLVELYNTKKISRKHMCELLSIKRNSSYYKPKEKKICRLELEHALLQIYLQHSSYGYRRMVISLWKAGYADMTEKKVRILMKKMGLKGLCPRKNMSKRNKAHKVYPYLLKEQSMVSPNQVWQVDITYIKIKSGFVYLTCLIDVFSRKIMGWYLSTTLETESCIEALNDALKLNIPLMLNSDQGCQFTSDSWINLLVEKGIQISMTGKGRCHDNIYSERFWRTIKHEWLYLHGMDSVDQARQLIDTYINYYNERRPHQSLNYHTPNAIFALGSIPAKEELRQQFILEHQLKQVGVVMN